MINLAGTAYVVASFPTLLNPILLTDKLFALSYISPTIVNWNCLPNFENISKKLKIPFSILTLPTNKILIFLLLTINFLFLNQNSSNSEGSTKKNFLFLTSDFSQVIILAFYKKIKYMKEYKKIHFLPKIFSYSLNPLLLKYK